MIKFYKSDMCPDCNECKRNLDFYKIPYEAIDINDSLKNLKEFLMLRDTRPEFNRLKAVNDIGLPALLLDDGRVTCDWEGLLLEKDLKPLQKNSANYCSIDKKNC